MQSKYASKESGRLTIQAILQEIENSSSHKGAFSRNVKASQQCDGPTSWHCYSIVLARASQAGILLAGSLLCQLGEFAAVNVNSCQSRRPMVSFSVAMCQLPT